MSLSCCEDDVLVQEAHCGSAAVQLGTLLI